jgi:1,4-dihydroxy-2-naphthoyl-CoA hydrolase
MTQLAVAASAEDASDFEELGRDLLPGILGIEFDSVETGLVSSRLVVERRHMAPNGFLHAASVIALADTSCGYGCQVSLPAGASGFTTVELKSNFMGTARVGDVITCRAWLVHGGRSTQIWDAEVREHHLPPHSDGQGATLALFRCTQMVLYPKAGR